VKWLLDTNVVSEHVSRRGHDGVIRWVARQPREDIAISAVTLAELQDGVAATADERRKAELTHWIDTSVLVMFEQRIEPVTTDVLIDWLALMRDLSAKGRPQAAADLLIASTARVHNLTVVTRNTRDFASTGVTVYNPWTDETQIMEAP
jgi:predicted nucleic acid-binding protein